MSEIGAGARGRSGGSFVDIRLFVRSFVDLISLFGRSFVEFVVWSFVCCGFVVRSFVRSLVWLCVLGLCRSFLSPLSSSLSPFWFVVAVVVIVVGRTTTTSARRRGAPRTRRSAAASSPSASAQGGSDRIAGRGATRRWTVAVTTARKVGKEGSVEPN